MHRRVDFHWRNSTSVWRRTRGRRRPTVNGWRRPRRRRRPQWWWRRWRWRRHDDDHDEDDDHESSRPHRPRRPRQHDHDDHDDGRATTRRRQRRRPPSRPRRRRPRRRRRSNRPALESTTTTEAPTTTGGTDHDGRHRLWDPDAERHRPDNDVGVVHDDGPAAATRRTGDRDQPGAHGDPAPTARGGRPHDRSLRVDTARPALPLATSGAQLRRPGNAQEMILFAVLCCSVAPAP